MTTPEQKRLEPRTSEVSGSLSLSIATLMLAMILGAIAVTLIVFGVWPGALLAVAAVALTYSAVSRIRREEAAERH